MNKPVTLIFYQGDGNDAKALAEKLRSEGAFSVFLRDAANFYGKTDDPADKVIILSEVSEMRRQMICETYPNALARGGYMPFAAAPSETFTITDPVKRGPGRPRKVI